MLLYAPDDSFAVVNGTDGRGNPGPAPDIYLLKLDGLNTLVKVSDGVSVKPVIVLHP